MLTWGNPSYVLRAGPAGQLEVVNEVLDERLKYGSHESYEKRIVEIGNLTHDRPVIGTFFFHTHVRMPTGFL